MMTDFIQWTAAIVLILLALILAGGAGAAYEEKGSDFPLWPAFGICAFLALVALVLPSL